MLLRVSIVETHNRNTFEDLTKLIISIVGGLTYIAIGIETNRPTEREP